MEGGERNEETQREPQDQEKKGKKNQTNKQDKKCVQGMHTLSYSSVGTIVSCGRGAEGIERMKELPVSRKGWDVLGLSSSVTGRGRVVVYPLEVRVGYYRSGEGVAKCGVGDVL